MSDRIYVATRKGLFTVDRQFDAVDRPPDASGWSISRTAFLAENCPMVLPDTRDGSVYAALDSGHFGTKVHRSNDEGETWEEIACPEYPEPPAGYEPEIDAMGREVPWKLVRIWSLEAGSAAQAGRIWCGTIPGGLFVSTDRGDSWELVRSLWDHPARKEWMGGGADYPGLHSICVDPRDDQRLLISVSIGGVVESKDLGQTWNVIGEGMRAEYMPPDQAFNPNAQDPHRLVYCPSDPDGMWVQHHNGIFRSNDGAKSWTELENVPPSGFGFAVAVHPQDPKTAWFVPAQKDEHRIPVDGNVVVARTRDGGESFDVLREGLPQGHSYDIVFRHALDVDDSGDRLAFGSTTGGLWISENQGDSWECISAHLPPVYCVRFVK